MTVQNPAPGYPHVIPYLTLQPGEGEAAIAYYTKHFGFKERMRLPMKDKDGNPRIGHCELTRGDSLLMLSDFSCMDGAPSGAVQTMIYIDDIDRVFEAALADGATETMALQDMFYGDRSGALRDPFGHAWHLAQHMRDVSEAEMREAMAKMNG